MSEGTRIRFMAPGEIPLAVDWAAGEGWNPGFADAACFGAVDPRGFWLAEVDGTPAATLSVVNYDDRFAFLGFYIVRPELRGRGIGWRLWQAGMAHAGARTVGLDGVVAQQANYARAGFAFAYRNIRFAGPLPTDAPRSGVPTLDLADIPFEALLESDAAVFPARRAPFLRAWISAPGHVGRALLREGKLVGWGVVRPARTSWRIGPLVASDEGAAEVLFGALCAAVNGETIVLDVPEPNAAAVALARRHGLAPVFETARMYTGPVRAVDLDQVYGVTSFELG